MADELAVAVVEVCLRSGEDPTERGTRIVSRVGAAVGRALAALVVLRPRTREVDEEPAAPVGQRNERIHCGNDAPRCGTRGVLRSAWRIAGIGIGLTGCRIGAVQALWRIQH